MERLKIDAWENSYERRENFVFYPCDEMVRFVARHLRKRVGLDDVIDVIPGAKNSRVLDLGCGIGRNLIFGHDMGLGMHGIDLSTQAITVAREWMGRRGVENVDTRVVAGDMRALPWAAGYFQHAVCDSALDSLPFDLAREGVGEVARTLQPGGLFYLNLISGRASDTPDANFSGEVEVDSKHEHGTIQSYFDKPKIDTLLGEAFEILSATLVEHHDALRGGRSGRWHVVARRR